MFVAAKHNQFSGGFQTLLTKNHQEILLGACAKFITLDLRPMYALCGEGLRCLLAAFAMIAAAFPGNDLFDLTYMLPHRDTVRSKIRKLSEQVQVHLKHEFLEIYDKVGPGGAFAVDIWTDNFKQRSYMCVTAHYIDKSFKLHCRTIANSYMDVNKAKDGTYVKEKIQKSLRKYGITISRNCIFISDRGSNMLSALRNFDHISCVLHFISNCLKKMFEEEKLKVILTTCKKLIRFIKKSGKNELFKPSLKSTSDVRFNYALTMFQSLLSNDNWNIMIDVVRDTPKANLMERINKDELMHLVKFLNLFERATKSTESTNYPTIHRVLAVFAAVETHLLPSENDHQLIKDAKNQIRPYFLLTKSENKHLLESIFHKIAIYLHPSLKQMQKIPPDERRTVLAEVGLNHEIFALFDFVFFKFYT